MSWYGMVCWLMVDIDLNILSSSRLQYAYTHIIYVMMANHDHAYDYDANHNHTNKHTNGDVSDHQSDQLTIPSVCCHQPSLFHHQHDQPSHHDEDDPYGKNGKPLCHANVVPSMVGDNTVNQRYRSSTTSNNDSSTHAPTPCSYTSYNSHSDSSNTDDGYHDDNESESYRHASNSLSSTPHGMVSINIFRSVPFVSYTIPYRRKNIRGCVII